MFRALANTFTYGPPLDLKGFDYPAVSDAADPILIKRFARYIPGATSKMVFLSFRQTLDAIDDGSREALTIDIDVSLPSERVETVFDRLVEIHPLWTPEAGDQWTPEPGPPRPVPETLTAVQLCGVVH